MHVGHGVGAVNDELADVRLGTTQAGVEHGAILGRVDVLASKHGIAALLKPYLARKLYQKRKRLIIYEVLRKIDVQIAQLVAHALDAS